MKTKTIIPIAIAAIFVTLAFVPAVNARNVRVTWLEDDGNGNTVGETETVALSDSDWTELQGLCTRFGEFMSQAIRMIGGSDPENAISEEGKAAINEFLEGNDVTGTRGIKDILKDSPLAGNISLGKILALIILAGAYILGKVFVIHVGWGKAVMPFNPYEWGWTAGQPYIKPLRFYEKFGYTGVINKRFILGWEGYDKMGRMFIRLGGFNGLWIDGGGLGWERWNSVGIEFAVGRAFVFNPAAH